MDVTSARFPARRRPRWRWNPWLLAARAVCVIGLVCGVLVWSVAGMAGTTVALVVLVWWLLLILGIDGRRRNRVALRAGTGTAGAVGLVAAAGAAGIVLLLLLLVTSPFARFLARSRRRASLGRLLLGEPVPQEKEKEKPGKPGKPGPRPRPVPVEPEGGSTAAGRLAELSKRLPRREGLVDLDDSALCLAWRQSFVSITATRDTRDVLELIELREQYLDELTRRHPVEISRWLASGARAASNPMRFIEG